MVESMRGAVVQHKANGHKAELYYHRRRTGRVAIRRLHPGDPKARLIWRGQLADLLTRWEVLTPPPPPS